MPSSCLVMRMRGRRYLSVSNVHLVVRDRERVAGPAPAGADEWRRVPVRSARQAQRVDVICAREPLAVDEKARRTCDTTEVSTLNVSRNTVAPGVSPQLPCEPLDVEAELAGEVDEVLGPKLGLMVEQDVVHRPEGSLCSGGLRRFGGQLGPGVHIAQRQVPPHVAQVPEPGQQLTDDRFGLAAVWALEVPILYERYRCARRPADMVTVLSMGSARSTITSDLPRSARARKGFGNRPVTRTTDQVARADQIAAVSTPILASSSWGPLNASAAINNGTVNPIPASVPPQRTDAHPTGGRSRPRVNLGTTAEMNVTPKGLPTL